MIGTGGAELTPHYVTLSNSGTPRRISFNLALQDWGCVGLLDFSYALFGPVKDSSYLKDFDQFMAPEWDGGEAKAVSRKDLKFARTLLEQIGPYLPGAPDAAPGVDGSICMEWIASGTFGQKKVFVDVAPGDEVLTFARLGEARPVEKHFKKSDQGLIVYLQSVFDFFATK